MHYKKNEELYKYFFENLKKGFIRINKSLIISFVLFILKS